VTFDFERPILRDGQVVCPACKPVGDICWEYDRTVFHDVDPDPNEPTSLYASEICADSEGFNHRKWCRNCGATFEDVSLDTQ